MWKRFVFMIAMVATALTIAAPSLAQQGVGSECTPAGVWYGGSLTAYQMTVTPGVPAGHYTVSFVGMYKLNVLQTDFNGEVVKKGDRYEGNVMALSTSDPDFVNVPPPIGKMPDLTVGSVSMRMKDCSTIESVIPFFGIYFGAGVWTPGLGGPTFAGKKPFVDPPDVDMLDVITGGLPIVETYRRVPNSINPDLLHK